MKPRAPTRCLRAAQAVVLAAIGGMTAGAGAAPRLAPVVRLQGEGLPLFVDVAAPKIAWEVPPSVRQVAYQVVVASSERLLASADVWDSGKVKGEASQVHYAGPALAPHARYVVQVHVWNAENAAFTSHPVAFETRFSSEKPEAWKAQWVSLRAANDEERRPLVGARWLSVANAAPPGETGRVVFTKRFALPQVAGIVAADFFVAAPAAAGSGYRITANAASLPPFPGGLRQPHRVSLLPHLVAGENQIWLDADRAALSGQGAVIGTLRIETSDGRARFVPTDRSWRVRVSAGARLPEGWQKDDPEKAPYLPVSDRGAFGEPVSAKQPAYAALDRLVPVAHMRKTFTISRPVSRARLHATAVGLYELHLNGSRVGTDVLAPGRPRNDGRLGYRSYDVTQQLRHGTNVLGALLAEGWPNGSIEAEAFGRALRAELHVRFHDGSSEVIATDPTWRGTTGAIRASEVEGSVHVDARRDMPGWSMATFDDRAWRGVFVPAGPAAALAASTQPLHVGPTVRVKAVSSPQAGAQVFDLGRSVLGWVRFRFRAPRGTRVTFRYGDALAPDGQVASADPITDSYVAAGRLQEVFEPKFSLHRFRYVQVAGHPVAMSPTALVGVEVSDAPLPAAAPSEQPRPVAH